MKLRKVAVVVAAMAMFSVSANAQDDCSTAVDVSNAVDPCLDTTPTGPLGSCTTGGGLNDVWLTFVATAAVHRIRTDVGSTGTDSDFIVYSGTCGNLTEIGCSEDEVSPYLGDIEVGGLTPGDTYIIQLGGWADSCGPFQVTIETPVCGDDRTNPLLGEECDGTDSAICEAPCLADCTCAAQVCGDNVQSDTAGEECDGTDSAACEGLCQADCTCPPPICGNGVKESGEQCDDGNLDLGDGCDDACNIELPFVPAVSEWGLVVMVLIGLAAGTVMFGRKRAATA